MTCFHVKGSLEYTYICTLLLFAQIKYSHFLFTYVLSICICTETWFCKSRVSTLYERVQSNYDKLPPLGCLKHFWHPTNAFVFRHFHRSYHWHTWNQVQVLDPLPIQLGFPTLFPGIKEFTSGAWALKVQSPERNPVISKAKKSECALWAPFSQKSDNDAVVFDVNLMCWLVVFSHPSEKYESVSWADYYQPNIIGKI